MFQIEKILIVEDERVVAMNISKTLENEGYETIDICASYNASIKVLEKKEVDLVLIDIYLKGKKDGIDLAKEINRNYKLPFIFISKNENKAKAYEAIETEPITYLSKPFSDIELLAAVNLVSRVGMQRRYKINETLAYCFETKALFNKEESVTLTKKEILFMEVMIKEMQNREFVPNKVIDEGVWGESIKSVTRRNMISRINNKSGKKVLKAVNNLGYHFHKEEEDTDA